MQPWLFTKIFMVSFLCKNLPLASLLFHGSFRRFFSVCRKKEEERRRHKDQQIWAARFMSEKLTKLGKQKAPAAIASHRCDAAVVLLHPVASCSYGRSFCIFLDQFGIRM